MSNNPVFLLTNAIVLTMDAALTQYEPGAVAVQGDHIAAVGPEAELRGQFPAAPDHRLRRQGADAGAGQRARPRGDDPPARPG